MNFTLIQASNDHKTVIRNLMQFYMYDFSEYVRHDVEDNGLFAPYPDLKDYWEGNNNKIPYIIKKDDKYVGFVLVKFINSKGRSYFSIAEFFILKKYRHEGIGKAIAIEIFDLHKGHWEVYQKDTNKPAQIFWNKVISEYTKGHFKERLENGRLIQNFEN
ncbi:MAG TPA: GNAT family N-acetyltransferase [Puia sp.]|nr:GNAT family N-acetyltransferase [Puia sp.]